VTGICLGSAYLEKLLSEKGETAFIKEMQRFVKLVAHARRRNLHRGRNDPLHLTVACEDYDRTRPFKDGIVKEKV